MVVITHSINIISIRNCVLCNHELLTNAITLDYSPDYDKASNKNPPEFYMQPSEDLQIKSKRIKNSYELVVPMYNCFM